MNLNMLQAVASWEAQLLEAPVETPMSKAPVARSGAVQALLPATLQRKAFQKQRHQTRSQPFVLL